MRRLFLLLAICAAVCQTVRSENVEWFTDAEAAQAKAKEEDKLVLLNFTGSDWCMWCQRLKRDVFDKPEFAQFAQTKLVLVEVDFPQHKTLPEAQQHANARLDKAYHINSYPTIILLDSDGRQIGRMGYLFGGASSFIAKLEKKVAKTKAKTSVAEEAAAPTRELTERTLVVNPPKNGT
jgi:protein disulfide-isomerase